MNLRPDRRHLYSALAILALWAVILVAPAQAGSLGVGGFGSPTIEHFTGLGLPFFSAPSIHLNGVLYKTADDQILYTDWNCCGSTLGEGLGNHSDLGFFDVVFDVPVLRAGGFMVASHGSAEFFDTNDVLLGTVLIPGVGPHLPPEFAGWQADTGLIKRIRFTDLTLNNNILVIDDIYSEVGQQAVPEPTSLILLGAGLVSLAGYARKKR